MSSGVNQFQPRHFTAERKHSVKIYIHTDLEGISGIDSMDMIERSGPRYRQCCECLMWDLDAAVDGALMGGIRQVIVLDSQGGGNNSIVGRDPVKDRLAGEARGAAFSTA